MNIYYKILLEFANSTTPCKTYLLRRYGKDLLGECIAKGYIVEIGSNTVGETIYTITDKGKQARNN